MEYVFITCGVVIALAIVLAAWRFFTLRSNGTPVILRRLPAEGGHGWRHGVFRYHGDEIKYYMLRSLAPTADVVFNRTQVSIRGPRELTAHEGSFLSAQRALRFDYKDVHYEMVCSAHAEMAFTAWVEAAPDSRMARLDPKELRRRMRNDKN
ncbi:DUF2550 domain-containing protein [Corynebacterium sp. SCR221107]|nr:DUF2550 domain-containing protein [Corynebacterium sp. SCR221107]WBT09802.1 DUF2550 domain-containing protein [Corynebacterium sp. SCR221107]